VFALIDNEQQRIAAQDLDNSQAFIKAFAHRYLGQTKDYGIEHTISAEKVQIDSIEDTSSGTRPVIGFEPRRIRCLGKER